jgi:hypothetical protein
MGLGLCWTLSYPTERRESNESMIQGRTIIYFPFPIFPFSDMLPLSAVSVTFVRALE